MAMNDALIELRLILGFAWDGFLIGLAVFIVVVLLKYRNDRG